MAEAPKKRAWFQIHLSSAVVLMFVAGILIYLNIHSRTNLWVLLPGGEIPGYGWPLFVQYWIFMIDSEEATLAGKYGYIHWQHLLIDALIALSILVVVAVLLEWRIRRKPFYAP